jgi:CDP-diacylglycerol--glycerol-3-phosphate 3-phosphatidyltransferase
MRPVGTAVARGHISPNAVTLFGVALHMVVAALIVAGHLLIAGFVAVVAALLDGVDGAVAKASGRVTVFGGFLDSTTDRLSDALYFVPIAWLYGVDPDIAGHDEPWVAAVALTALVASFLVSYVKARAEGLGLDCNVGFAERAERLILVILALLIEPILPVLMVVLATLAVVTVLQRVGHVYKQTQTIEPER